METVKISTHLAISRLSDMFGSLIYLSFIGHFIADSLVTASWTWAIVSFFTVMGIGFFSTTMLRIAHANNLDDDSIAQDLNISFRCSLIAGLLLFSLALIYLLYTFDSAQTSQLTEAKALTLLAFCLPAVFIQLNAFNFFNGARQTQHEILHIWQFNSALALCCFAYIKLDPTPEILTFMSIYVILRWVFAALAIKKLILVISHHIPNFHPTNKIPLNAYVEYSIRALPLAICISAESFLFLTLSFISKSLDDISLAAYQASLHFLSIVYMISIGIGNGTGIMIARHFTNRDLESIIITYFNSLKIGMATLIAVLVITYLLIEKISLLYTSELAIRQLIEKNITLSIPFLFFEYIYVVTRLTLRSMNDLWTPTLITIISLNILGPTLAMLLITFHEQSVSSIFIALTLCSATITPLLVNRLARIITIQASKTLY